MNARQRRFVEEYLRHGTAARAAREAGYAAGSARTTAARLLKTRAVRVAIEAAEKDRAERMGIEQDQVLAALAYCAYATLDMFQVVDGEVTVKPGVPRGFLVAVQGVRYRESFDYDGNRRERTGSVVLVDKGRALSLAMRNLGILRDKLEVDIRGEWQREMEKASDDFSEKIATLRERLKPEGEESLAERLARATNEKLN